MTVLTRAAGVAVRSRIAKENRSMSDLPAGNNVSRLFSRRRMLAGAAATAAAVPLAAASSWGPWGSKDRFLAHAQAAPIQFTLVPSGIATLFPSATATVSITPGDLADDVQVVAQNLPPNITFTCFFIQS